MERYRDEQASDPRELLLIDDIFYPINTRLAARQATREAMDAPIEMAGEADALSLGGIRRAVTQYGIQIPSSLMRKNVVARLLSGLLAVRPITFMNGDPSSGPPSGRRSGPSCITGPVAPVETMSTASSSGDSGFGWFVLV